MKLVINTNQVKRETAKAIFVELNIGGQTFEFWTAKRFAQSCGKNGYRTEIWFPKMTWEFGSYTAQDIANALADDAGNHAEILAA